MAHDARGSDNSNHSPVSRLRETNPSGATLAVRGVTKSFPASGRTGGALEVLAGIDFTVGPGEFVSVVGPSGSGKSTLLNIVSGLDEPSSGEVAINGDPRAQRLGVVAYMHQRDLLLPWRNVLENAILGLEILRVPGAEARQRAARLMPVFGLNGFEHTYPRDLSGGMRQRVALMRSMLPDREVLLLDEPFGALDAITRTSLHEWLSGLLQGAGKAVLLVTHDVEEAVLLSDRVHVMSPRPGAIMRTVDVDLPRPRAKDLAVDSRFVALKAELLAALSAGGRGA